MTDEHLHLLGTFSTARVTDELKDDSTGNAFGTSIADYRIVRRRDVRNLESKLGYILAMRHRIVVPASDFKPGPRQQSSYDNYPALLLNSLEVTTNNKGRVRMQRLFPRTLNAAVSVSRSSDQQTSGSISHETSTGSTSTNVNTFGVGVSFGFFGELPVGNLTLDYSHSWEDSQTRAQSESATQGTSASAMAGETMSVKDWSSYGFTSEDSVNPTWVWCQSYPWDVVEYSHSEDGDVIHLPKFVKDRLHDGDMVLPPSQLSLFGLDFTMTATWLLDFPDALSSDETISISHTTKLFRASHSVQNDEVTARLENVNKASVASYESGELHLSKYSLVPLAGATPANGAAIGFRATPFAIAPKSRTTEFKILSPANTLQVTGTGFDARMTTDFSSLTKVEFLFKIADYNVEYALHLLHWIGPASGAAKLSWTVNKIHSGVNYVDSPEGDGGQGNLLQIDLRNLDFTSINFHDYLVIGTNVIEITVEPVDAAVKSEYSLVAATVGMA